MTPHTLTAFLRRGEVFVVPCLPTKRGIHALDVVVPVPEGLGALAQALREAEALAEQSARLPAARREFGENEKLVAAAGCRTWEEFIVDAVQCTIVRTPRFVLVMKSLPDLERKAMWGTPRQDKLPPDTPIETLAQVAKNVLEGKDGW